MSLPLDKAKEAVVRAAIGCIDKTGHAYHIATSEATRTFYLNELSMQRLEHAVAKLKEKQAMQRILEKQRKQRARKRR